MGKVTVYKKLRVARFLNRFHSPYITMEWGSRWEVSANGDLRYCLYNNDLKRREIQDTKLLRKQFLLDIPYFTEELVVRFQKAIKLEELAKWGGCTLESEDLLEELFLISEMCDQDQNKRLITEEVLREILSDAIRDLIGRYIARDYELPLSARESLESLSGYPLHAAIVAGNDVRVQRLVEERRVDIHQLDQYKRTPLQVATIYQQGSIARYLLQQGAFVDGHFVNATSVVPPSLYWATRFCYVGVAHLLLQAKADVNRRLLQTTPLLLGVQADSVPMVRLFLNNGAKIDATDGWGDNVFHIAAKGGKETMIVRDCFERAIFIDRNALHRPKGKVHFTTVISTPLSCADVTPLDMAVYCENTYMTPLIQELGEKPLIIAEASEDSEMGDRKGKREAEHLLQQLGKDPGASLSSYFMTRTLSFTPMLDAAEEKRRAEHLASQNTRNAKLKYQPAGGSQPLQTRSVSAGHIVATERAASETIQTTHPNLISHPVERSQPVLQTNSISAGTGEPPRKKIKTTHHRLVLNT